MDEKVFDLVYNDPLDPERFAKFTKESVIAEYQDHVELLSLLSIIRGKDSLEYKRANMDYCSKLHDLLLYSAIHDLESIQHFFQ